MEAALGATFSLGLLFLAIDVSRVWHDGIISLTWPRAEAIVLGDPQLGHRVNKRGYPYNLTLRVTLPNGREVTGRTLRPVFNDFTPTMPPPAGHLKAPPRLGDRLSVHIDPAAPERMMPRQSLFSFWWAVFMFGISGALCGCFVHHLCRRRPT